MSKNEWNVRYTVKVYHISLMIPGYEAEKHFLTYDEAMQMIQRLDRGWYDDHAVRYKDGRKLKWLVKYEYHC